MHLRLLLIEDSPTDAELLLAELAHAGYAVTVARVDTAASLTRALDQDWDLAISDFTMPRFSGTDALGLLRSRDRDLPFIFLSGTIGEEAAVAAIKAGAQDFIMKGNRARLLPAIDRELRDADARRERSRMVERLAHLAYHDPLTDLPNRALFFDRLQQALRSACREGAPAALLFLDLDRFKAVNDSFGHQCGDLVLQEVARRLTHSVRAADTVARLGGDEFALLLPFTGSAGAEGVARKVLQEFERPMLVDAHALTVHASIGIALCPDQGTVADAILRSADAAMYLAKAHTGSAYIVASGLARTTLEPA